MEENKLEHSFKQAIEEVALINGRAMLLNICIEKERVRDTEIATTLTFRDLTIQEGLPNLYIFSKVYAISTHNLNDELDVLLSRELLLQVAQLYEIVETYLYNVIAEFVRTKNSFHIFPDSKANTNTFKSIRKALKGLSDRVNNKHLLTILRANSNVYQQFEKSNVYNLDFGQWYEMFSELRHCVTHQRMKPDATFTATKFDFHKKYFDVEELDGKPCLFVTYQKYGLLASRVIDFIAFIYKIVAQECYGHDVDYVVLEQILSDRYHRTNTL